MARSRRARRRGRTRPTADTSRRRGTSRRGGYTPPRHRDPRDRTRDRARCVKPSQQPLVAAPRASTQPPAVPSQTRPGAGEYARRTIRCTPGSSPRRGRRKSPSRRSHNTGPPAGRPASRRGRRDERVDPRADGRGDAERRAAAHGLVVLLRERGGEFPGHLGETVGIDRVAVLRRLGVAAERAARPLRRRLLLRGHALREAAWRRREHDVRDEIADDRRERAREPRSDARPFVLDPDDVELGASLKETRRLDRLAGLGRLRVAAEQGRGVLRGDFLLRGGAARRGRDGVGRAVRRTEGHDDAQRDDRTGQRDRIAQGDHACSRKLRRRVLSIEKSRRGAARDRSQCCATVLRVWRGGRPRSPSACPR